MANNSAQTIPAGYNDAVSVPDPDPSVLLICVKYGADEETAQYLESVRRLRGQRGLQLLVVDNKSDGKIASMATGRNCNVVRAPENLGYFGGARHGLSLYLERNTLPDWVIISNVDLAISDPKFLINLAKLEPMAPVGAVAPSIRSTLTGKEQNPFMRVRPSPLRMHIYKWLFRNWLALNAYELASAAFHKVMSAIRHRQPSFSDSNQVLRETIYAPHGSFLILSRKYFDRGGDLQFPGFLFGEEIYIAESMRRLGLEVVYEPALKILHQEHRSTKLFRSRKMAAHVASSAAYCAEKFFPLHSRA